MRKKARQIAQQYQTMRDTSDGLEAATAPEDVDHLNDRVKAAGIQATPEEIEVAVRAQHKIISNEEPDDSELMALEAIILPAERPVVDVVEASFGDIPEPFEHFGTRAELREHIETAIPAVGRIGLPERPDVPFAGTGFIVGDGVMMTNRHVAQLFAEGLGQEQLQFINGQTSNVNFTHELGQPVGIDFAVDDILMIHPFWDMALLEVSGLEIPPLDILAENASDLAGRDVAVIGYPAFDGRNNAELQFRIFRGSFNVKRLQPGRLNNRAKVRSFGNRVDAATHDCSTLGGNSGSCVIDVGTGKVVALHFAGRYLEANYAVPMSELARDARVHDKGVNFNAARPAQDPPWIRSWLEADRIDEDTGSVIPVSRDRYDGDAVWTIPLQVSVTVGQPLRSSDDGQLPSADTEALVEPFHEETYDNRKGYDPEFLGPEVALPEVADTSLLSHLDNGDHVIPYQHFSLAVHKIRRMALYTAANIDGLPEHRKPDPNKSYSRRALSGLGPNDHEKWFTDPRIPALHQLPDKFFTKDRTAFDKGHLVRRDAVAWGETFADLRRANGDTYHVTNCSPQVKEFNRSNFGGLWGKLENIVLDQLEDDHDIYSVFSGPIFSDDDDPFAGVDDVGAVTVLIPKAYWKIVVAPNAARDDLETYAFRLEQDLDNVDFGDVEGVEFAVSDIWKSRMVSIESLESEIGVLTFPAILHETDKFEDEIDESLRGDLS